MAGFSRPCRCRGRGECARTHSALRPGSGVSTGDAAIRIVPPGACTRSRRPALLGSVCIGALALLGPGTAHAVDGNWQGPGAEWTIGTNWSSSPIVPDGTATFGNSGPTSVTISSTTSINHRVRPRGAGLLVHRSEWGHHPYHLHGQQQLVF